MGLFILKINKEHETDNSIEKIKQTSGSAGPARRNMPALQQGDRPVYTIVLFLFSGTIIGFFFRTLSFVIKIILVLLLAGIFV